MPRVITKIAPRGMSLSGGSSGSYFDGFRRKRVPSREVLVREYKRLIYTCTNRNAAGISNTPLRLYLKTSNGDSSSILRRGIDTKEISDELKESLCNRAHLSKTLAGSTNIEEVVDHPSIKLLQKANDSRFLNGDRLSVLTSNYLDLTGAAYWLVERDPVFRIPKNLWILPSQWVTPIKQVGSSSRSLVDYYEFKPPNVGEAKKYFPQDVIQFLKPGVTNPYVEGTGCLEACFDSNEVNNKLLSLEEALLSKEARPDAMLVPKGEDGFMSPVNARRLERQWNMRFGQGKIGGVYVPEEDMQYIPIQVPPRDLARLEIGKVSGVDVSGCFDVPYALVSDASHNRQQLEAAMILHGRYGIFPRTTARSAVLNDLYVTEFDESGRLFYEYDDPVPENRAEKLSEITQLVMNGIYTPNEGRHEYGKPPMEGGDELRPINVSPDMGKEEMPESEKEDSNSGS